VLPVIDNANANNTVDLIAFSSGRGCPDVPAQCPAATPLTGCGDWL
jgi:hypothetical protein